MQTSSAGLSMCCLDALRRNVSTLHIDFIHPRRMHPMLYARISQQWRCGTRGP